MTSSQMDSTKSLCPADAGRWTKTVGHVENAIVDDEIRVWVSAIRAKGAFVWVIVDTCHAGTDAWGAREQERERYIPASVLVPEADSGRSSPKGSAAWAHQRLLWHACQRVGLPPTAGAW